MEDHVFGIALQNVASECTNAAKGSELANGIHDNSLHVYTEVLYAFSRMIWLFLLM